MRNEAFRQKLARAIQPLAYHKPLSDVVGRLPALPRELGVLLASAESCGELEAGLLQASARCSEAEHAGRQRLGWVLAMGSYALAASYVAARLVLFSVDQFSRIVQ